LSNIFGSRLLADMGKPIHCRVGFHKWQKKWDHERSANYKECSLCGTKLGTGWPGTIG